MTTVAIVWRGKPGAPPPKREDIRLGAILDGFEAAGATVDPVPFYEEALPEIQARLGRADAVLTWVDPIVQGRDRTQLDALLRELSKRGVYVSAHPDVILQIGTKDVLVKTRDMEWGSDTHLYATPEQFQSEFPRRLAMGTRVLKQHRGSSGGGVWKVELVADGTVEVLEAARESRRERLHLAAYIERCRSYFDLFEGRGQIIDQPYQDRLTEGMTRAYLAGDRVAGFGHQLVTALAPLPVGTDQSPVPPPRYYFGPDKPEFEELRRKLESGWITDLQRICGVETSRLPAIWDCDFLLGPKDVDGNDTYMLCEINISGVFPIPDESIPRLVEWTLQAVERR